MESLEVQTHRELVVIVHEPVNYVVLLTSVHTSCNVLTDRVFIQHMHCNKNNIFYCHQLFFMQRELQT